MSICSLDSLVMKVFPVTLFFLLHCRVMRSQLVCTSSSVRFVITKMSSKKKCLLMEYTFLISKYELLSAYVEPNEKTSS